MIGRVTSWTNRSRMGALPNCETKSVSRPASGPLTARTRNGVSASPGCGPEYGFSWAATAITAHNSRNARMIPGVQKTRINGERADRT